MRFDQRLLMAAIERQTLRASNPFHPFSSFDTASLAGFGIRANSLAKGVVKPLQYLLAY